MATKKTTKQESTITIEDVKVKTVTFHLVGDSPLILNGRARSYVREETWKQYHPKGSKIPDELDESKNRNIWEKLITAIHWEKPIEDFDDYSKYTQEQYEEYLRTNRPCILPLAFGASFGQAFTSFGFKESTGLNGTDFKRCVSIAKTKTPVDFTSSRYDVHLTPNTGISRTNVIAQYTEFSGWSCDLEVMFAAHVIPLETLTSVINTTGQFIGVGTRRAEGFGRYHIESVSESLQK